MRTLTISILGLAATLAAGCSASSDNTLRGNVGGLSFSADHAFFDIATHSTLDASVTVTELRFFSYDGCAFYQNPAMKVAAPSFEIAIGLDSTAPPAGSHVDRTTTTPGEFAIGSSGLARPANGLWLVGGAHDQYAGSFTGGTISLAKVTATTIEGDLEITSPNGDYAVGSFAVAHCAAADW